MRDRSSSSAIMTAIVVGTYVCALYGAFGTPVSAHPPAQPRTTVQRTPATQPMPPTRPALVNVADLASR